MPLEPLSISGIFDKSSDSDCGIGVEPCIWQLPPNGPVLLMLCFISQKITHQTMAPTQIADDADENGDVEGTEKNYGKR